MDVSDSTGTDLEVLKRMVEMSGGKVQVMAGGGVNAAAVRPLLDAGVEALHFSAMKEVPSGMVYRSDRGRIGEMDKVIGGMVRVVDWEKVEGIIRTVGV